MEDGLRARTKSDPLRPQPKPGGTVGRPDSRLPVQRATESGTRHVDEEGTPPGIPHGDLRSGRAAERQMQRTRTEPDAVAGRGTRDGCRGRSDDERQECASHLPITVNVSVAV